VRVRTAIVEQPDGSLRALFYAVERPTTDLSAKMYRITDVLNEWRAAERRLRELDPASAEAQEATAEVEVIRQQYQQLSGASKRSNRT
jgi:hypothetical protein